MKEEEIVKDRLWLFRIISPLVVLAGLGLQLKVEARILREQRAMDKIRDEVTAMNLETAKRVDAYRLHVDQMERACEDLRGLKRN
jgi:hypothetical protein